MSGIDGTVVDSCTCCLRGTDTAVAFVGSHEGIAAALMVAAGVPTEDAALLMVEMCATVAGGAVGGRAGELQLVVRLCETCLVAQGNAARGLRVGLIHAGAAIPTFRVP